MRLAEFAMYPLIEGVPVVYEDDWLIVVDKPSGVLSQPGKSLHDSVLSRVLNTNRELHGSVLVHRLDMDTSGLLLLAKTRSVHRKLQQQFEHRQVVKRYQAILEHPVVGLGGRIHLPVRLDIDDRPRQIVCKEHGKVSTTLWHRTDRQDPRRLAFYPLTGRTHQLRVHAASALGLGQPIQGDRLYGSGVLPEHLGVLPEQQNSSAMQSVKFNRLMLHADFLKFQHPHSLQEHCVNCPAPF